MPFPPLLRFVVRSMLRTWSRFPKAPGVLYQLVERWGSNLAVDSLDCRLYNGAWMRCDLTDQIQRQIYFFGAYEPIEAFLFRSMLASGMTVIDAGANVGQYTLIAAMEVGSRGGVHAFEPVPNTFQQLQTNVVQNNVSKTVRTNMNALWNRTEHLELHLERAMVGNQGAYTIGVPSEVVDKVMSVGVRLDDYVVQNRLQQVDLIKLDIEGAEWFALLGASETISRWRPTMLVEINRHACRQLGYEPEEIWDFLRPFGYVMWVVGQSAETSRSISSLAGVERANVFFYVGELAPEITKGWTLKSVLRFHRSKHVSPRAASCRG